MNIPASKLGALQINPPKRTLQFSPNCSQNFFFFRICSCVELYVLRCKGVQYFKSQPVFRSNMSLPSSWSRNGQSKKLACRALIPVDSSPSLTIWIKCQQFMETQRACQHCALHTYGSACTVSNLQCSTDQQSISFLHKATQRRPILYEKVLKCLRAECSKTRGIQDTGPSHIRTSLTHARTLANGHVACPTHARRLANDHIACPTHAQCSHT
jgi:hypothetical protein